MPENIAPYYFLGVYINKSLEAHKTRAMFELYFLLYLKLPSVYERERESEVRGVKFNVNV